MPSPVLRTVLVAPSRYDEHGVMVYRVGIVQNGSLASLAGLIEDYNRRRGAAASVRYELFDEKVREPVTAALLRDWRDAAERDGERFVLMVCGVQTATWPRARDVCLLAVKEGIPVVAGGVHLSAHGPSLDFLLSCGVSVGVGEVDTIFARLLDDALAGRLAPIYKLAPDAGLRVKSGIEDITVPVLEQLPYPHLPREALDRYLNKRHLFIDSSRGCPFLCSFCVVKNAFGRAMRSRDPEALLAWIAERYDRDRVRYFGFIDDNFLRNPLHLEVLEGLARLRAGGRRFQIGLMLDVEASCYAGEDSSRGERSRRFLRLCRDAGVASVFIGLESTNDGALVEMHKQVNRDRRSAADDRRRGLVERYRGAVRAWQDIGAWVDCGYILGWEADDRGAGRQASDDTLAIGIDVVNFYHIAPLPGAEDYARAVASGTLLETDFNDYFKNRPMLRHPRLTPAELEAEHTEAVRRFYAWRHVLGRVARGVLGIGRARVVAPWTYAKRQLGFKLMILAGLHSYYEGGLLRRRGRRFQARREAISDEDARLHYLGETAPRAGAAALPAELLREGSMESLPILRRHVLASPPSGRTASAA